MPDGEMRRPPQLWEQKLSRITSILGVGISSSGDGTSIVEPSPPPGDGGGIEPAPVLPAPGTFKTPSTPTLSGTVQGIRVSWNGLNSDGDPYPTGAYVEVHISTTGATFTPDATTLAGTLLGSAGFFTIGALTAGTTYYVRLVGVDEAGNKTSPSTAASSQTGLTTTSDYGTATIGAGAVSFNARQIGGVTSTVGTATPTSPVVGDIWLDTTGGATTHKRWNGSTWETILFGSGSIATSAITSTKIADDAITTPKIAANAVTAAEIAANTITASQIAANTITSTNMAAGSITAGAIAANAVTTAKLDAAAVTADKIAASAITADKIAANAVTAAKIDADALTAKKIQTSASGERLVMADASATYGADALHFYSSTSFVGAMYASATLGIVVTDKLWTGGNFFASGSISSSSNISTTANMSCDDLTSDGAAQLGFSGTNRALRVDTSGNVYSYGLDAATTTNAANVRVGASAQLLKSTSTVRIKDQLVPVTDDLAGVAPEKLADFPASIDPYDVLAVTPTEFRSLCPADQNARVFGFIAEDVAAKLPWAANWDDDGLPSAVEDRPILAALLAVVRDQQATIADLTARIEALEA